MSKVKTDTVRRDKITIVGAKVTKFVFKDSKPNCIFINNFSANYVYVSRSAIVNTTDYEMIVTERGYQSFTRILGVNELYFYAGIDGEISLESFEVADMKPSDIPETQPIAFINTNPVLLGNVGITGAIPAGSNNIGDVDILTLPALPTGANVIGKVNIDDSTALKKLNGAYGFEFISDQSSHPGNFVGFQIVTACVISAITAPLLSGNTFTGVSLPVGFVIQIPFTSVTLTSGSIISYKGA